MELDNRRPHLSVMDEDLNQVCMQRVHINREEVSNFLVGKLFGQTAKDLLVTDGQIVNANIGQLHPAPGREPRLCAAGVQWDCRAALAKDT
jgi:hypothetical protein